MILSDKEILMEIRSGGLRFDPAIEDSQISPSSIDLHLSDQFTIFTRNAPGVETVIDLKGSKTWKRPSNLSELSGF